MSLSRLRLDFTLQTSQERSEFLATYIQNPIFSEKPPTDEELEMMGNYLLWGKDPDGKSCVQKKEIQVETKNKTWQRKDAESLDALLESPTFAETMVVQPSEARHTTPRVVFSRKETLQNCGESLRPVFEDLFYRIDRLEVITSQYDLIHGKREKEIRPELLRKFNENELAAMYEKASHLNQFKYLKMRHLLVELRREQFTLADSFKTPILHQGAPVPPIDPKESNPIFEAEIPVFPLGVSRKELQLFPDDLLRPGLLGEEDTEKAIHFLWEKRKEFEMIVGKKNQKFFDFRNLEHVYELFLQIFEVEDAAALETTTTTLGGLLDTLWFYVRMADISEVQRVILDMKIKKIPNIDVAAYVNKTFGKSYTANYISTIFRQKIIPKINDAAALHEEIVENLCFEENFKTCTCCGKTLLLSPVNFVRKSRSKDGFATRCKICDREERIRKKETQK